MKPDRFLSVLIIAVGLFIFLLLQGDKERTSKEVSGLAVDLGSRRIAPALSIRIISADGKVIYGEMPPVSDQATGDLLERGLATFAANWAQARERVGQHPLIVKSIAVDGGDIIISNADAAEVLRADAQHHFLQELRVAIVFSKPAGETVESITNKDLPPDDAVPASTYQAPAGQPAPGAADDQVEVITNQDLPAQVAEPAPDEQLQEDSLDDQWAVPIVTYVIEIDGFGHRHWVRHVERRARVQRRAPAARQPYYSNNAVVPAAPYRAPYVAPANAPYIVPGYVQFRAPDTVPTQTRPVARSQPPQSTGGQYRPAVSGGMMRPAYRGGRR